MIPNTYLTLHEPFTALSTLQILDNLIFTAHHETDTVIISILQIRKLKSQRLIYIAEAQAFQMSVLFQPGFSRKEI